MPEFIDVPFDTDADTLSEQSYGYIQTQVEGWEPEEAGFERIVIDGQNRISADSRNILARIPTSIFRYFGKIVGLLPNDATFASALTTWTMIDDQGYTIPAGTTVGFRISGDELVYFDTMTEVTVPPGNISTAEGEVPIQAQVEGLAGSGLGSAGGTVELVDPLDPVLSPGGITQVQVTQGGDDAETDEAYKARLSDHLSLMGHALVLSRDYEAAARGVPGVFRAMAIDGYNPNDNTEDNERTVAVAGIDTMGLSVSAPVKASIQDLLASYREANFQIFMMDPTYTAVDVQYDVSIVPGYTDMQPLIDTVIGNYFEPAGWGFPESLTLQVPNPTVPPPNNWVNEPNVYFFEVAQAISNIVGVARLNSLKIALSGNVLGTADLVLPGRIPLPQVGALDGTVHYL